MASKNVALPYEGACHRCGLMGHRAKNCSKPRVCTKCGMGGHVEKFCGMKQKTAKEKALGKYGEVCHRCGVRGHVSRECSVGGYACRICGERHRVSECPKNPATLENMIRSRRHEVTEFARQKEAVAAEARERRMSAAMRPGAAAAAVAAFGGGAADDAVCAPVEGAPVRANAKTAVGTTGVTIKATNAPRFVVAPRRASGKRQGAEAGDMDAGAKEPGKRAKTDDERDGGGEEEGEEGGGVLGGLLGDYASDSEG